MSTEREFRLCGRSVGEQHGETEEHGEGRAQSVDVLHAHIHCRRILCVLLHYQLEEGLKNQHYHSRKILCVHSCVCSVVSLARLSRGRESLASETMCSAYCTSNFLSISTLFLRMRALRDVTSIMCVIFVASKPMSFIACFFTRESHSRDKKNKVTL